MSGRTSRWTSSGSRDWHNDVYPARSANRTVTSRRWGCSHGVRQTSHTAPDAARRGAPQPGQSAGSATTRAVALGVAHASLRICGDEVRVGDRDALDVTAAQEQVEEELLVVSDD